VGPRADLDAVVVSKLEPPIIEPVTQRYTTELSRLLILYVHYRFNLSNFDIRNSKLTALWKMEHILWKTCFFI
jgi:hypothetical protein